MNVNGEAQKFKNQNQINAQIRISPTHHQIQQHIKAFLHIFSRINASLDVWQIVSLSKTSRLNFTNRSKASQIRFVSHQNDIWSVTVRVHLHL